MAKRTSQKGERRENKKMLETIQKKIDYNTPVIVYKDGKLVYKGKNGFMLCNNSPILKYSYNTIGRIKLTCRNQKVSILIELN